MTHLLIKNKGLVDSYDLTLIGSSTKRNNNSKIGFFGSGWKYALAWFLRNDIEIKIFSGEDEIKIDYDITLHRDKPIRVLNVNGEKTSITAEMGPQWTGWMALREIISNAIDEGSYSIKTLMNTSFSGEKDATSIFIPLNNELSKVVKEYDHYFAFDRKPTYTNKIGSVYLTSERHESNIYRKGIRCLEHSDIKSVFDFDFNDIYINESRVTDNYEVSKNIRYLIEAGVSKDILLPLLKEYLVEETPMSSHNIDTMVELIQDGYVFIPRVQEIFGGVMSISEDDIVIPDEWYKKLVTLGHLRTDLKMGSFIYQETKNYNTQEVEYHLSGIGLNNIKVICGQFHKYLSDVKLIDNYTVIVRDDVALSPKQVAAECLHVINPTILEVVFK